MQAISTVLEKVMPQQGQLSRNPQSKYNRTLEILRNPSDYCISNGVNAFDVVPSIPVKPETLSFAKELLEQNFGTPIPSAKWMMLCQRIIEEDWSEERFKKTLNWFIDTKKFPSWTIADWFEYGVKLYPFRWVREYCHKNGLREVDFIRTLDVYMVDGIRLYKFKDGVELPLEKIS